MIKQAHIAGPVEYREGDGINITIPLGPCEVDVTATDVTISWADGGSRGSAAMPVANYQRYVSSHAIELDAPGVA